MLEKTLESPLDCKEIQPVHPKGNQSPVFIGRTDVEAETPILCTPDAKGWLIWKDLDSGKGWGQYQKETTEDEMASPTQWTWVWVDSGGWWWTGRPGELWFMRLQKSNTTEWLNLTDPEGWYGEGGGRGFRIGNTCTPVADSCWYMAKPIQYCKVISLQLK